MIKEFLEGKSLDIRVKGKMVRPFDQKLTPDVVYTVCLIIYEITKQKSIYKNKEIINSAIFKEKTTKEFGKPMPGENTTNEYDKFVGQTTQMLIYADIVERISRTKYKVVQRDILNTIIEKEIISTMDFLYIFFKEVFKQSEFKEIDVYINTKNPDDSNYNQLKKSFIDLMFANTNIKSVLEPRRILAKPLNMIAYKEKSYGTIHGRSSKRIILLTDILYARTNSRDTYKPKDIPRRLAKKSLTGLNALKSMENKVKQYVKVLSQNRSDISNIPANQAHHILPKLQYPEFISTPENIIILTPNEHFLEAHPNNNTKMIDKKYQIKLLKRKREIINNNPSHYDIDIFNNMLSIANIEL